MTRLCRTDGRCQYAIDHGAEGLGHCPPGKCCMPQARLEHIASADCWCEPTVEYIDPETNVAVYVHKDIQ
jgi:hypothetical protein